MVGIVVSVVLFFVSCTFHVHIRFIITQIRNRHRVFNQEGITPVVKMMSAGNCSKHNNQQQRHPYLNKS